jgi:hypothetical protein
MVYSAIPLGSSLMCFRFLQVMVGFVRTGELPHHDHGHVDGLEEAVPPVDVDVLIDGRQPAHARPQAQHGRKTTGASKDSRSVPKRRKKDLGGEPK